MKTKDIIKTAVINDTPLYLIGESGWGKSEMVKQVGDELGLEVIVLSLSQIMPEDIGGIPQPNFEKGYYKYLSPQWSFERQDKSFILFLDEINQALPATLHAVYSVVLDRVVAGVKMKDMRIVAAGNLIEENENLTAMMQPLLNRFPIQIKIKKSFKDALNYLNKKYPDCKDILNIIEHIGECPTNPRLIENGLRLLRNGVRDREVLSTCLGSSTKFVLEEVSIVANLKSETATKDRLMNIAKDLVCGIIPPEEVGKIGLSPEECEIVINYVKRIRDIV